MQNLDINLNQSSQKSLVLDLVYKIPKARATTYGYIGKKTGINPQVVGWIMSGLSKEEMDIYPWQRVVAKNGVISALKMGLKGEIQIQLLALDGVICEEGVIINYENVYWEEEDFDMII